MKLSQLPGRILKWAVRGISVVFALFLLLAMVVYLPPVQRWIKDHATKYLSEETGMKVTVGDVRLSFPLDLRIAQMSAVEGRDTIVAAGELTLDVRMLPLLRGEVSLNGFALRDARINSRDYISDTRIEGRFNLLAIDRPAVCNLGGKRIDINKVRMRNADVRVILSDTARQDTTPTGPAEWTIALRTADLRDTRFHLQMPGDSMRIGGDIKNLKLSQTDINLKNERYCIGALTLAAHNLAYDLPHEETAGGFDSNHLLFEVIDTELRNLVYDKQKLDLNLAHLALKEKSGIVLNKMTAGIHYDSTRVDLNDGYIETPHSTAEATVHLPFHALKDKGREQVEILLKGSIGKEDIVIFMPEAADGFTKQYPDKPLEINLRANGTAGEAEISYCNILMDGNLEMRLNGKAYQIDSEQKRNGKFHYTVSLKDVSFIRGFMPKDLQKTIRIPNDIRLGGDIAFNGSTFTLSENTIYCRKGSLKFNGTYAANTNTYSGKVNAVQFPCQLFLPGMGLSPLTADFDIRGRGTDFLQNRTTMAANANIRSFAYNGISLDNIGLIATLDGPNAEGSLKADNKWLKGLLNFTAEQKGPVLSGTLNGSIDELALNLGIDTTVTGGKTSDTRLIMDIALKGYYNSQTNAIAFGGDIDPLNAVTSTKGYPSGNVRFGLGTSPDSTHIYFNSGDMVAFMKSTDPLENIINGFSNYAELFGTQFAEARIDQDTLKSLLPNTHLRVRAGQVNPIQQILSMQGYRFDSLYVEMATSPQEGINGNAFVDNFQTGSMLFEKTRLNIAQESDKLRLNASLENSKRKNPNKFSASVNGALLGNGFSADARFADADGREGLNIGTRASFDGLGGMRFSLTHDVSTIAYRKFNVNHNNYVAIAPDGTISADLDLLADDNTGLKLFSIPTDSANQDITLSITRLNLRDISNIVPFIPQMAGLINGDIHVLKEDGKLTAVGALETTALEYEGTQLGSIGTELFYMPEANGHYVVAQILKDGNEIAVLDGHYNSNESESLNAILTLNSLPCNILNPMLGDDGTLALKGHLNGEVSVGGPLDKLEFNGQLSPDSIHAYSELYGFDLRMENKDIAIRNSKIKLDNVNFFSKGKNPLVISGDVDMADMGNMITDLSIRANDFELISAQKTKKSMVYGKVFVDMNATLQGKAGLMVFRGNLKVLDKTNVSYVMTGTPLQIDDQFAGLVEFVDFEAPETPQEELAKIGGMFIDMGISISEKAHLHCELSADGKSYLDCKGGGDITLRIFPSGDMAVNGRFNINSGEMKYTLPFIPLKTFTFAKDNHIIFNGDVTNPTLNITALESTKASVTDENGASRMVEFKVGVAISRQLSDMKLEFLIDAPEDTEVQSELATMSAETKNKLAVTMLATGMYVSSNNKSGFKANNALNAFIDSEIQNIAGNALKSFDLSVGVEGNTTSTGETQTDYTFQFSKKLWNDRVAIVIGGKVTTGASDETSSSQSFIDNVSFEYQIDRNSTRFIRVFYDNDTYEPLEGHYSSAGAGYIVRRKTNNLGDLFIFKKKKK